MRAKKWKQPKSSSTDEWVNTMWYIHKIECNSTEKKQSIYKYYHMGEA